MKAKQTRGLVPLLDRTEALLFEVEAWWRYSCERPDSDHVQRATPLPRGTSTILGRTCESDCPACDEARYYLDFYKKVRIFRDGIKADIVKRARDAATKRGKGGGVASAAKAEARYEELLGDMDKLPKPTPKKIAQQLARAGKPVASESTIRRAVKKKTVNA